MTTTRRKLVRIHHEQGENVEEMFKVANFDSNKIEEHMIAFEKENRFERLKTMFDKTGLSGFTRWPIFFFVIFYYIFNILYKLDMFAFECVAFRSGFETKNDTNDTNDMSCNPNEIWLNWIKSMAVQEKIATRYLTFVLGFYVGTIIKRWWDQVSSQPAIDPIISAVVGFVKCKEKGQEKNALELRKKILRYCLLSWTMALSIVSPHLREKLKDSDYDYYIEKGLLDVKSGEDSRKNKDIMVVDINKEFGPGLTPKMSLMRWWLPMTWAINLVNIAKDDEVKEKKDFIAFLNRYQAALRHVIEFQTNPLPRSYGQALLLAVISWAILGIFGSQYTDTTHVFGNSQPGRLIAYLFFSFPYFQIVKMVVIVAWMRAALQAENPFDYPEGHNDDVDLTHELEHYIWKASLAVKTSYEEEIEKFKNI